MNLAIDYVVSHLRDGGRALRLERVARAAFLSPFHFHRVFQALMGETLADFVRRLRLQKALAMMAQTSGVAESLRPSRFKKPLLMQIAMECGFASSSDFSRCFKQRFGAAPSAFDIHAWRESHRAELEAATLDSAFTPGRDVTSASASRTRTAATRATVGTPAGWHIDRLPARQNSDGLKVRIRDLPARTVAYIRVGNPYRGDAVFKAAQRLMKWADRQALAGATCGQWLGYQWDNPEITSLEDCRYYVAVEVARVSPPLPQGEIGRFRFPPMVVAQVEVRGGIDLELRALQWLYGTWLPRSGYMPDDHPCFEAWIGRPFVHGTSRFEINVQLPVCRR